MGPQVGPQKLGLPGGSSAYGRETLSVRLHVPSAVDRRLPPLWPAWDTEPSIEHDGSSSHRPKIFRVSLTLHLERRTIRKCGAEDSRRSGEA